MSSKVIQEQFGQEIIDAMARFAKRDIKEPAALQADEFSHVHDPALKTALAETLYGTRWLYKLGLALLANNVEQYAHVRAQIIDYASIAEALLADVIAQAYIKGKLTGGQYTLKYTRGSAPLVWNAADPGETVAYTTFEWRVKVAHESGIIDALLSRQLNGIRTRRNTVHLTAKVMAGAVYYAGLAKRSHEAMHETIRQTKVWVAANP
ncbi:hypothetical protein [Burkholderia ubonensis]|uniref:hypothetical protein n=1 Tax=Burkholderia ubonensis TaxID=101571 RepID=UPI000A7FCF5D|nr:hypothetical protein [Burkholderia ubonensis]